MASAIDQGKLKLFLCLIDFFPIDFRLAKVFFRVNKSQLFSREKKVHFFSNFKLFIIVLGYFEFADFKYVLSLVLVYFIFYN